MCRLRPAVLLVLLALLAFVRFELHAFDAYRSTAKRLRAQDLGLQIDSADVALRDLPRAQKLMHGGWFEDAHYKGEVSWYPSMRPAVAVLTAKLTGARVLSSYYYSDFVLTGLGLIAAFVLVYAASGGVGVLALAAAVCAGFMPELDESNLYPGQSVRPLFFCLLACCSSLFVNTLGSRGRALRKFTLLGVFLGLLSLWHGASFVLASYVSGLLLVVELWSSRPDPDRCRGALWHCALVGMCSVLLFGLAIVPQWLHYGHFAQAESARLWLETSYRGGHSAEDFWSLSLFPRELSTLLLLPFAVALAQPQSGRRLWPIALVILFGTFLGHLGFLVHDAEHPRLMALAQTLLVAPPHTFWGTAHTQIVFAEVIGLGWSVAWVVKGVTGTALATVERRSAALQLAVLGAALCVGLRPLPTPEISGRAAPLEIGRFASKVEAALGKKAVDIQGDNLPATRANLYLLWTKYPNHTNPYAQPKRTEDYQALLKAAHDHDSTTAQTILDRYDVGGFIGRVDRPSELVRFCGGPVLVASSEKFDLELVAYRGRCGENATR